MMEEKAKALRSQLRAAGYPRAGAMLPEYIRTHGIPCIRNEARDEQVRIRFAVGPEGEPGELVAELIGGPLIASEHRVWTQRAPRPVGRPSYHRDPMRTVSIRMPESLVARLQKARPGKPIAETVRAWVTARLNAEDI